MGFLYDATGFEDPNLDRALDRVHSELARADLSSPEREALRTRLLGLEARAMGVAPAPSKPVRAATPPSPDPAGTTQGIDNRKTLSAVERNVALELFRDTRKKEGALELIEPAEIRVPNLPLGLTVEAISEVVSQNRTSIQLCAAQALKEGETLKGKLEVEISIGADGAVRSATVATARLRSSAMGACMTRRILRWRFPRFDGEPVAVFLPFLLSAGI
jgi:hypothetical protein